MPLLIQFVPEKYKDKIVLITVQEMIKSIEKSGKHNVWIDEFKMKYGLH
jgi:hypothetical protein